MERFGDRSSGEVSSTAEVEYKVRESCDEVTLVGDDRYSEGKVRRGVR